MSRPSPSAALDDDSVARAAADWIVRLSADDPTERDQARTGFEAWKRADPRHAAVAAGMERFIEQARRLRGDDPEGATGAGGPPSSARAARAALDAALEAPARRSGKGKVGRRAAGLLALVLALGVPTAVTLRAFPPSEWLADARTATGEQRTRLLADGTRLVLGSASAVNDELSPDLRRVELLSGEMLVDVAKDASRPFIVETAHGRIRALGTRFIVRRDPESTLLTMLESKTAVSTRGADAPEIEVEAGQQTRLSARGIEALDAINPGLVEDAFRHQRLMVEDRPLSEVLDELARHRSGAIRYERSQIDGIRVSAVLPLDDTGQALQLLATNFPQLRVRTLTPWLVLVDSPAAPRPR